TGRDQEPALALLAQDIRQELELGEEMLHSDDHHFPRIVDKINEHVPGARLIVTVAMPNQDGQLVALEYGGQTEDPNAHRVLLLQGANHYEAVVMAPGPGDEASTQRSAHRADQSTSARPHRELRSRLRPGDNRTGGAPSRASSHGTTPAVQLPPFTGTS